MRIVVVAGTRPEFIKLAPVVQEFRKYTCVNWTVIATGQHTDLLRGTPFENAMTPDVNLGLASSNSPLWYAMTCEGALRAKWARDKPDLVVVQGDTASAYAGAMAAFVREIPLAHIEAGIRSGDTSDPDPEEGFRIEIDEMATWHYCPTLGNEMNVCEGYSRLPGNLRTSHPVVTGNTGIDALYSHTKPVAQSQKVDRVLITLHRRESFGEPLANMIRGIFAAATKHPHLNFIWPSHPNPRVQSQLAAQWPETPLNVYVRGPLDTVPFAQMLATSRAVITDSGGVQEEACALGVPAVIARQRTDRPESVELGLAKVAGRTEAGILTGLAWALDAKIEPSTVFGDGKAAPRIVEHLLEET